MDSSGTSREKALQELLLHVPDYFDEKNLPILVERIQALNSHRQKRPRRETSQDFFSWLIHTEYAKPFTSEFDQLCELLETHIFDRDFLTSLRGFQQKSESANDHVRPASISRYFEKDKCWLSDIMVYHQEQLHLVSAELDVDLWEQLDHRIKAKDTVFIPKSIQDNVQDVDSQYFSFLEKWRKLEVKVCFVPSAAATKPDTTPLAPEELWKGVEAAIDGIEQQHITELQQKLEDAGTFSMETLQKRDVVFTDVTIEGLGPFLEKHSYKLNHIGLCLVMAHFESLRSNGVGKTTLGATAFVWCLTNELDHHASAKGRKIADIIHRDALSCTVKVVGAVKVDQSSSDYTPFSIERIHDRNGKTTSEMFFATRKVRSYKEFLEHVFGLPNGDVKFFFRNSEEYHCVDSV
eukprot:m.751257 g.751257  ORF g.751257 m.751257 type:complete len:407 (+) comp23166_c0_seq2:207-1427(+)